MSQPAVARAFLACLTAAALPGCRETATPAPQSSLGEAAGATVSDTALMRDASAAVNEALRVAADCEAARPLAADARQKLDEVEPRLRTPPGRAALDTLRAQLARVESACP